MKPPLAIARLAATAALLVTGCSWLGGCFSRPRSETEAISAPGGVPSYRPEGSTDPDVAPLMSIVKKIQDLESVHDPKCHATANRVEDYVCGSQLTFEARLAKVEAQKRVILRVWRQASGLARTEGRETVSSRHVRLATRDVLQCTQAEDGTWTVQRHPKNDIKLSTTDLRHYGSIAYSLRAILSVKQDDLLGPRLLLPADGEAIESMRLFLDVYSLAMLRLADRSSRTENHRQVLKEDIVSAADALSTNAAH